MTNPWIQHVKQYAKEHNLSYKDALKKARPSYQKGSGYVDTTGKYHTDIPLMRRQKGNNPLIAKAIGDSVNVVGGLFGKIGDAVRHRREENGFYAREKLRRNMKTARRMAKKYGGKPQDYLSQLQ